MSPSLTLCLQYVDALSVAADAGSTLARDYCDVAIGEFRDRLEEMVIEVMKREGKRTFCEPKARQPTAIVAKSVDKSVDIPRQGMLF